MSGTEMNLRGILWILIRASLVVRFLGYADTQRPRVPWPASIDVNPLQVIDIKNRPSRGLKSGASSSRPQSEIFLFHLLTS